MNESPLRSVDAGKCLTFLRLRLAGCLWGRRAGGHRWSSHGDGKYLFGSDRSSDLQTASCFSWSRFVWMWMGSDVSPPILPAGSCQDMNFKHDWPSRCTSTHNSTYSKAGSRTNPMSTKHPTQHECREAAVSPLVNQEACLPAFSPHLWKISVSPCDCQPSFPAACCTPLTRYKERLYLAGRGGRQTGLIDRLTDRQTEDSCCY